jgi:hypothetical protein
LTGGTVAGTKARKALKSCRKIIRGSPAAPSLNTTALEIAAKHWQHGIIYTNGIKKVPVHVPFRIAISIWGAKDSNERLRGAASYGQALQTAKEDQRALILPTINRQNIDDIPEIVEDCVEQGVKLSFNDFRRQANMRASSIREAQQPIPSCARARTVIRRCEWRTGCAPPILSTG